MRGKWTRILNCEWKNIEIAILNDFIETVFVPV